ncbi:MAG: HAD hydrolase-like protein, partial [Lachnospiraceae bacterium]|nr:HAD hydrolase-like protein [Lachnospiraceae bacterium]
GADDYAKDRSTKEQVVRYAMEQNGITDTGEVIMVGDRKYDVIGAAAVGIQTIGVLYGFGDEKELSEAGAVHLVKTPAELAEYLLTAD